MPDSLGQVLPHAARAFGDRTALICEGRSFSFLELDALSDALAAYKAPRSIQFVADLPKTSTGKIMRRELRTLDG